MAKKCGISRQDFMRVYTGHETDKNWLSSKVRANNPDWQKLAENKQIESLRERLRKIAVKVGLSIAEFRNFSRVYARGAPGGEPGEKRDGRGKSQAGHLHRQEIHQPRLCSFWTSSRRATSA